MSAIARSEIGARYASAFFDLAQDEGRVDALEQDLTALQAAISASDDLRALIENPVFSRDAKQTAMAALLDATSSRLESP